MQSMQACCLTCLSQPCLKEVGSSASFQITTCLGAQSSPPLLWMREGIKAGQPPPPASLIIGGVCVCAVCPALPPACQMGRRERKEWGSFGGKNCHMCMETFSFRGGDRLEGKVLLFLPPIPPPPVGKAARQQQTPACLEQQKIAMLHVCRQCVVVVRKR